MKKIKKIIYLLPVTIAVILYSCGENFLFKVPYGQVATESLNTAEGVNKLLIGAYSLLDGSGTLGGWPGYAIAASVTEWVWDCASDDAYTSGALNDQSIIKEWERFVGLPTNFLLKQRWMVLYDGVSRANDVLKALNTVGEELSDDDVKVISAQARFLRAFYHFRLQRTFYQVPYITEDDAEPDLVLNDHVIWDEIETDLQIAIEDLPESWAGEPGKISKYAAMALKAYVHLHQREFSKASPLLDDIINSGNFQLVDNFHLNYMVAGDNNRESIFEVQRVIDEGTGLGLNGTPDVFITNPINRFVPTCCGLYQPSQDLVNAFKVNDEGLPFLGINGPKYNDENLKNDYGLLSTQEFIPTEDPVDPRLDWTVGRRGIPYLDWGIFTGNEWQRAQVYGPYESKKVMFSQAERDIASHKSFARSSAINTHVIRYAHVLLWRAECAVEENNLTLALDLVNQVRRRASDDFVMGRCTTYQFNSNTDPVVDYDQPAANYLLGEYSSFPSQEFAREAVHMETRLETAMEGNRFFDLRRWGKLESVMTEFIDNDIKFRTFMQGATFNIEKNDFWPLPQDQVDLQSGILIQDPSY